MHLHIKISVLMLLVISSCISSNNRKLELSIVCDTISIPGDSVTLSDYTVFGVDGNSGIYYGYNRHLHSIDIFNLDDYTYVNRISLEAAGPEMIPPVESIFYHNKDTIFLSGFSYITVVNDSFEVRKKINPYNAKGFITNNIGSITSSLYGRLIYHSPTSSLIFSSNMYEDNVRKEVLTAFDIVNDSIYFLPAHYPERDIKRNVNYGLLKQVNFSMASEKYIYFGFTFSPGFYKYQFDNSQQIPVYPLNGDFIGADYLKENNPAFPDMNDHALKSPAYYDPLISEKGIFQFAQYGQNLVASDDSYNNFNDKKWHLMIYDIDVGFIGNHDLGSDPLLHYTWFVYDDKVYISPHPIARKNSNSDLTSLVFLRFNLGDD